MGIVATATIVPPSEYRKRQQSGYTFPKSLKQYWLDKAWTEIDKALQAAGPPLNLAVRGNRAEIEPFDEFEEVYSAFATPALVKKINLALSRLNDSRLLELLREQGVEYVRTKSDREYTLHYFHELKSAYKDAAKKGCYLWIFMS